VLLWDTAEPGGEPVELGRHDGGVRALAALADGRVVSGGGFDGRVLLWDVSEPGAEAVELGRHDGPVWALAALAGGRLVSGGADGRVLLWDLATGSEIAQLSCSSTALAAATPGHDGISLVIAHAGEGLSFWSVAGGAAAVVA
jgi:WD40 repeat protein